MPLGHYRAPREDRGGFIADSSLVLYLPLYELDGTSFVSKDGYGHLATVTGALWTPQGRVFDGTDDYISIPAHAAFEITEAVSIEVWFNKTANSISSSGLVSKSPYGSSYGDWDLWVNTADQKINFTKDAGTTTIKTAAGISNATWYHLVITYDRINMRMYLNTVAETPVAEAGAIPANARGIGLGQFYLGTAARRLNGVMGEVRIYNRALSLTEIQHNYLATKWRYL